MRTLAATELLDAWERGHAQHPLERALTLLAAVSPGTSADALASLSAGRRDAGLLALRERTFGSQLVSLADCPSCAEKLELAFDVSEIRAPSDAIQPERLVVNDVAFRLPDSRDLMAAARCSDAEAGRELLLQRCLLDAGAKELSPEVIGSIVAAMAEADPQADVQIALHCPACGHHWLAVFDIVTFLWSELNAWAHRTLQDVHRLAAAYGWREPDILALSPWRRQIYLELAGA